jgi:hypothetical protein
MDQAAAGSGSFLICAMLSTRRARATACTSAKDDDPGAKGDERPGLSKHVGNKKKASIKTIVKWGQLGNKAKKQQTCGKTRTPQRHYLFTSRQFPAWRCLRSGATTAYSSVHLKQAINIPLE